MTANPVTMPRIAPADVNLLHQTLSTNSERFSLLSENAPYLLKRIHVPVLAGHKHARAKNQHNEARDDEPPAGRRGFIQEASIEIVAHGVGQCNKLCRGGRRDRGQGLNAAASPEKRPWAGRRDGQDERQAVALEGHAMRRVHRIELIAGNVDEGQRR